jgi:hypothetical protein
MKWILLFILAACNFVAIWNVFAPSITDWAQIVPEGITCTSCESPDVQLALAQAAVAGREPFLRGMQTASYWLFAVGAVNIFCLGLLLGRRRDKV